MPIVFEEVTGEIAPDTNAPADTPAPAASPVTEPSADSTRRVLHLLHERERRVRAD